MPLVEDGSRREGLGLIYGSVLTVEDVPDLSLQSAASYFIDKGLIHNQDGGKLIAVYGLTDANVQDRPLVGYAIAAVEEEGRLALLESGDSMGELNCSILLKGSGVVQRDGRVLVGVGNDFGVASLLTLADYVDQENRTFSGREERTRPRPVLESYSFGSVPIDLVQR